MDREPAIQQYRLLTDRSKPPRHAQHGAASQTLGWAREAGVKSFALAETASVNLQNRRNCLIEKLDYGLPGLGIGMRGVHLGYWLGRDVLYIDLVVDP